MIFFFELFEMLVVLMCRRCFGVEESRLAEKERFYLKSVVPVLGHVLRIEGRRPKLKGFAVFPEAEGARQCDEERAFPISRCFSKPI